VLFNLRCVLMAVVLALLAVSASSFAIVPDRQLTQYAHNVWRTQDGALTGTPTTVTQTSDGYIWIGTRSGLLRFDGVRFLPWSPPEGQPLPSSNITNLLGGKDGSLWIGTSVGLARWKSGRLTNYSSAGGFIGIIMEDHGGHVWMVRTRVSGAAGPICQISDAVSRCYGAADGVPIRSASTLLEDAHGDFWAGNDTTLLRWRPGSSQAYPLPGLAAHKGLNGIQGLARTPDGNIWVGMSLPGKELGLRQFSSGAWKTFRSSGLDGGTLDVSGVLALRDNALIVATQTQGFYRIRNGKADHFRAADGLSSDTINGAFEDREGNLWIATGKGLDCFTERPVISYGSQQGLSADSVNSVYASTDGSIWVGNWSGLDHLIDGAVTSIRATNGLPGIQITSLFEEHPGLLWVGIDNGLWIYEGSTFRRVLRPDGAPTRVIKSITQDRDGSIWAATVGTQKQLLHIQNQRITEEITLPEAGGQAFLANPTGGILVGLSQGRVASYESGELKVLSQSPASSHGAVNGMSFDARGRLLAATTHGVFGVRNGIAQTLSERNGLPCMTMNNLTRDLSGSVWLSSECGLIRILAKDLDLWWDHPEAKISFKVFDALDGVQTGRPPFFPSVSVSPDGRLWYANESLLQTIDPANLGKNALEPPVHIEQIIADRKVYGSVNGVRLPALERDLEVDYTALSFVSPMRVRFRYKLEGHDSEWQEPGTRRQAFYTDLPPGHYRFQVVASNNDDVWNSVGDITTFAIDPTFYQTLWFKLFSLASAAAIFRMFYAFRVRQVTTQIQGRLGAKLEERERIARELHDTLLQGFQGLMLRFQAVLKVLPVLEPAHQMMEKVMDRADQVLLEGRQSVRNLREEGSSDVELAQSLARYGEELTENYSSRFSLSVKGTPQSLEPVVFNELNRVAREAMFNCFQHSQAPAIEAELTYTSARICVSVRDNGIGIDSLVLHAGKTGHWGLSGMRERAKKMGAELQIWSSVNAGTEVQLTIPAKVAYLHQRRVSFWKRPKPALRKPTEI
jgi:signal transduction histidine kinase/ligand-binding sensor domain-containing protein